MMHETIVLNAMARLLVLLKNDGGELYLDRAAVSSDFVMKRGPASLVKAMLTHSHSFGVQERGSRLQLEVKSRSTMVNGFNIDPSTVVEAGPGRRTNENGPKVPEREARDFLKQLIETLRGNIIVNDETAVVKALTKLWKLMEDGGEYFASGKRVSAEFCLHGGHVPLVAILLGNLDSLRIQKQGIHVIASVAHDSDERVDAITQVGGFQAVFWAMLKFRDSRPLLGTCFSTLINMTCRNDVNAWNLIAADPRGIAFILGTINDFMTDEGIVERGCWLLMGLC